MERGKTTGQHQAERAESLVDKPISSKPRAHLVALSQEQIERFDTNRVNGVMMLAVVDKDDTLPKEATGGIFNYLIDEKDNRVIIYEKAVALHLRYLAKVAIEQSDKNRLNAYAGAYDYPSLGVSVPTDRIVDIDT